MSMENKKQRRLRFFLSSDLAACDARPLPATQSGERLEKREAAIISVLAYKRIGGSVNFRDTQKSWSFQRILFMGEIYPRNNFTPEEP